MFYCPYPYEVPNLYMLPNFYIVPYYNDGNTSRQMADAKEFVTALPISLSDLDKEIVTRQVSAILQELFFPEELQALQTKLETYVNLGQIVPKTKLEAYRRIKDTEQIAQEASELHSKAVNVSILYFAIKAVLGILIKKYGGQTFLPLDLMNQYFNEIVDFKIIEQVTSTDQFQKKAERLFEQIVTNVISVCGEIPD